LVNSFVLRSVELLGESNEKPFRSTDVAKPIRVFIPDYFAYELQTSPREPRTIFTMALKVVLPLYSYRFQRYTISSHTGISHTIFAPLTPGGVDARAVDSTLLRR
jgi:hypothetical protein